MLYEVITHSQSPYGRHDHICVTRRDERSGEGNVITSYSIHYTKLYEVVDMSKEQLTIGFDQVFVAYCFEWFAFFCKIQRAGHETAGGL